MCIENFILIEIEAGLVSGKVDFYIYSIQGFHKVTEPAVDIIFPHLVSELLHALLAFFQGHGECPINSIRSFFNIVGVDQQSFFSQLICCTSEFT